MFVLSDFIIEVRLSRIPLELRAQMMVWQVVLPWYATQIFPKSSSWSSVIIPHQSSALQLRNQKLKRGFIAVWFGHIYVD